MNDIYVRAHYRSRGVWKPKWIACRCDDRTYYLYKGRGKWSRGLKTFKLFFKRDLQRELRAELESGHVFLFAVR